jgi:hypothetical protein
MADPYTDDYLLEVLMEDEGYDLDNLEDFDEVGHAWTFASVVPGICRVCLATVTSCEPDARTNWCPDCHGNTVVSGLELLLGVW